MTQLISNNASTKTVGALLIATPTITVVDGSIFSEPTGTEYELLTLHDATYTKWEVVTLSERVGNVLTVGRGIEGTQQAWNDDVYLSANITAKTLNDIISQLETTTATADQADTNASLALAQIADLPEGGSGGGGPATTTIRQIAKEIFSDGVIANDEFSFYTLRDSGTSKGLRSWSSDNDLHFPMPNLGYCKDQWSRVMVWRNGVLQNLFLSVNLNDVVQTSPTYDDYVQILGPRHVRFWPLLAYNDEIVIRAPESEWLVEGSTDNKFMDEYAATGVTFSYLAGGNDGSFDVDDIYEFSWDTCTSRISTAAGQISNNKITGSGAASDSAGSIFFFGGAYFGSGTQNVEKLAIAPLATVTSSNIGINTMAYGDTFTDKLFGWICGLGSADTSLLIGKYDLTLETGANISAALVGFSTRNLTSFCDETHGSIFNAYDVSGLATEGQFQKFACATDTIEAPANIGSAIDDNAVALLFRSGKAYIWDGYTSAKIFEWDTATETIILTQTDCRNYPDGDNHGVVCDGEHQAQSNTGAMMYATTGVVSINRTRLRSTSTAYVSNVINPVGSATDYWSAC